MLCVHPKLFYIFIFAQSDLSIISFSLVSVGCDCPVKTNHFQAASHFSHALFIQWGQPLEVKVCLQILGPETDAFLSLSFVTVVFCK